MRVFLIAGKAGSGKGEVAKFIKEFYIYKLEKSVITEFSKYLKLYLQELTEWDGNPKTKPRKELQTLGAKIRKLDENFLINRMIDDIEVYSDEVDNVIVADVRLPKEMDILKSELPNVYSIYVENQFSKSILSVDEQADVTETSLESYDHFDYILANDEYDKLKEKVFKVLESLE